MRFLSIILCLYCAVIRSCQKNVEESELVVLFFSIVNSMFSVVLFMVCKISFVLSFITVARTSSTYLSHVLILLLLVMDLFSRSCITASARKLESGDPIGVPKICL
jgi:hypothetical protein